MQNCYNFKNLISKYLDGEISYQEKQNFENHLEECQECRSLFEGIKATQTQLKELQPPELSSDFMPNLRNKILQVREDQSSQGTFANFFQRIPVLSYGFAAALLVAVTVFSVHQYQKMAPAAPAEAPNLVKEKIKQSNPKPVQKQFVTTSAVPETTDSSQNTVSDSSQQENLRRFEKNITPVKGH